MNNFTKGIILSLLTMSTLSAADSLSTAFSEGKASGQIRSYYMNENNEGGLQDYYGLTLGGKLKYETAALSGFNLGFALYTTNFLADDISSDHTEPTANNKGSRYVQGLVDTTDADNDSVTGLGEVYLNYKVSKTNVTLGRMKLITPFINPEDGRMIPTLEQGLWVKSADVKDMMIQAGFINGFWNRSTPEWKSTQNALGYGYAQGKAPNGKASAYLNHTTTDGIYVASLAYSGIQGLKVQFWDYYLENIMNVAYVQADYKKKFGDFNFIIAGQYIAEQQVGDGGNSDASHPEYSYIADGESSQTYGAKIGLGYKSTMLTLAGTQITDEGRFLFPREWGKEPLFTFQKRERTDGSGDATSLLLTLHQDFGVIGLDGFNVLLGIGKYNRVDVKDTTLNKYGVPSYVQTNIDMHYNFSGALKGFSAEYLIAMKHATGNTYNNPNYVFRKNGINIHNFIVNYTF